LIDTEMVLLKLLSTINENQLSTALLQTDQQQRATQKELSGGSASMVAKPVAAQRKASIEYWNKFPLNTSEDVVRWLTDRNMFPKLPAPAMDTDPEKQLNEGNDGTEIEYPGEELSQHKPREATPYLDSNRESRPLGDQILNALFTTEHSGSNVDYTNSQHLFTDGMAQSMHKHPGVLEEIPTSDLSVDHVPPRPENPGFAFSSEFKNNFIW
jgi:hypothetical protein